ncbi:hypothetical protein M0R72_16465 [Candidatus Pacearchaeota archaeon]|jgi:hypothetical protein|nr:hypothetical protein [Candidatus Pacearchaeota archaeon]
MPDETKTMIRERLARLRTLTEGEEISETFAEISEAPYKLYKEEDANDFSIRIMIIDQAELQRIRMGTRPRSTHVPHRPISKTIEEFMEERDDHDDALNLLLFKIDELLDQRRQ